MKGKIAATLFALPFLAVGVWMQWSIGSAFRDAWQMRDWVAVEAELVRGGYTTNSGSDSDTHEAYAEYVYSFAGQRHVGTRVALSGGGDNVGDYQQRMGRRLQLAAAHGDAITVYVDPDAPGNAIIDRGLRWGLLGFKSIFLFVFGGFGLGLMIFAWRAPPEKDAADPAFNDAPWLLNDDWQTPVVRSSSRKAMWVAWGFAAFWNLISAPIPFLLYEELTQRENYLALIGLLFPMVGVGLLVWAIRRTLEWRRFGPAPVTLDPFPGSIGGHVGGTIDLNLPFDSNARFELTLDHLHSYLSGSSGDRSRREEAEWQDTIAAYAEPGANGTRLIFRFDVPEGLSPSDAKRGESYYLWRLTLHADLAGTDIDRRYDIPVYATSEQSQQLSDRAAQKARYEQDVRDDESVGEIVTIRNSLAGKQLFYPMGRHAGPAAGGLLVGAIFAAAGWWLFVEEGQAIFGGVFAIAAMLIATVCLYLMLNSLEVAMQAGEIRTVRRLLGLPISRQRMHPNDFVKFEKKSTMKSQSGGKHVIYYSIYAVGRQDDKLLLGEGFRGESEARAAMRVFSRELGLSAAGHGRVSHGEQELPGILT